MRDLQGIDLRAGALEGLHHQLREISMLAQVKGFATGLGRDEEGTALLEYTILLGIIVVAVITTVVTVGTWTSGKWTSFCNSLPGIGAGC